MEQRKRNNKLVKCELNNVSKTHDRNLSVLLGKRIKVSEKKVLGAELFMGTMLKPPYRITGIKFGVLRYLFPNIVELSRLL